MKVKVDHLKCAGCGLCSETLPNLFYINGYHSVVTETGAALLESNEILCKKLCDAALACPVQAIEVLIHRKADEQSG